MTDVLAMGLNIEQEIALQKQAQNISLESELFSIPIQDYQQFYCQRFLEATKLDYTMAGHPSSARWVINSIKVNESEKDTHFLFVSDGEVTLNSSNGEFLLRKNCFAAIPGNFSLDGSAQVLVATRLNYTGFFTIGGLLNH